jgi:hypothetical protein
MLSRHMDQPEKAFRAERENRTRLVIETLLYLSCG